MGKTQSAGNRGEAAVARYLRQKGYTLLASQWRCRFGELDLVAQDRRGTLCIVEVKLGALAPSPCRGNLWTAASSSVSAARRSCIWRPAGWTCRFVLT